MVVAKGSPFAPFAHPPPPRRPGISSARAPRPATTISRKSIFNQTDLTFALNTGAVKHKLLVGAELGQQDTDNLRNTGFFNNTATSVTVPLAFPTTYAPVVYRQAATDANNSGKARVAALYVQEQIELAAARWA